MTIATFGYMTIDVSWRYGVVGLYIDRDLPILRVYPLPFVRFSFDLGDDDD